VTDQRKRVLFVCIGNMCRSQMAEAFARVYGSDILIPASAGVSPGYEVAEDTVRAMREKHIDLRDHFPKAIRHLGRAEFDIVVNMSGLAIAYETGGKVMQWRVDDPYTASYARHCEVRDDIERRVMELILQLRQESREARNQLQKPGAPSNRPPNNQ